MKTPVGFLHVRARGETLLALSMEDTPPTTPIPATIAKKLEAYFAGEIGALDDLDVDPSGTEFQRAVWAELRRIPAGETISYSQLAQRIGKPRAVRAVGAANGRNPIGIVVPCHRVIGADGSLTGFGGGLHVKRFLLDHEGALLPLG